MNRAKRTLIQAALATGLLVILGAWSYESATIKLVGNLNGPLELAFYNVDGTKPINAKVANLGVSERTGDGRWIAVWSIVSNGKRIRNVRYGECPAGFKEEISPKKLSFGKTYAVFASDGGGGNGGSPYFGFKKDGSIVMLNNPDEHP